MLVLDARDGEVQWLLRAPGESSGLVRAVALDGDALELAVQQASPLPAASGSRPAEVSGRRADVSP